MALLASPYFSADGMNEYGMIAAALSLPQEDSPFDTNKITIHALFVVRLVLDYAKTVNEAVDLLKKYNISFNSFKDISVGAHYILSDRTGNSVIIEFVNHDMKVIRSKKPWQAVTNFKMFGFTDDSSMDWRYKQFLTNSRH